MSRTGVATAVGAGVSERQRPSGFAVTAVTAIAEAASYLEPGDPEAVLDRLRRRSA
jgi:hypothetical protein